MNQSDDIYNFNQQTEILLDYRKQEMQELDILIRRATNHIMTQYPAKYYQESAFNEKFDSQLTKLVTEFNFNFHIIAFRLEYMFPQFYHKINYKSVSYRWGQLHAQKYPKHSKKQQENMQFQQQQQCNKDLPKTRAQIQSQKQLIKKRNDQQRKVGEEKLKIALELARQLDQQEIDRLIIYRPKFIIDNAYKLERQDLDSNRIQDFLNNQSMFDFGNFDNLGKFAESLEQEDQDQNLFQEKRINANKIVVQNQINEPRSNIKNEQKQRYLDDDQQQYQSD